MSIWKHRVLRTFWSQDGSLAWTLVMLIVAVFFILPVVHHLGLATLIFTVFFVGIIFSTMQAMRVVGTIRQAGVLLAAVCILAHLIALIWPEPTLDTIELILNGIALCFVGGITLLRVFGPGAINANRMMGAVAVYLITGLIFANLYQIISALDTGALMLGGNVGHITKGGAVYFSYATLTTVGYGDVVPVTPMARSLAALEAIVGQLYPAVFIGSLIALSATRKTA